MRCAISVLTGIFEKIEVPRSPWTRWPSQVRNCRWDRLVEAELGADPGDVVDGGELARDHRRRIAWRQVQQAEHEHRHHRHHRDGREHALDDVGVHERRRRPGLRFEPPSSGHRGARSSPAKRP
jgi:hypothetical protein